MVALICDVCGDVISKTVADTDEFNFSCASVDVDILQHKETHHYDCCTRCSTRIYNFIRDIQGDDEWIAGKDPADRQ